jgi:FkbM family methyltransferase
MARPGIVRAVVKGIGRALGYDLRNVRSIWGVDVWNDVERLAGNRPVRTIFDVGANVGNVSLALARRFPEARVLAFEPVAKTYQSLVANVGRHPRIRCFNLGLGPEAGPREIFVYDDACLSSLIRAKPILKALEGREAVKQRIDVTTLDIFIRENAVDEVDLVKIDTEGYDLEVMKGGRETLSRSSTRFVYCEFHTITAADRSIGGGLVDFCAFLEKLDYRLAGLYIDYLVPEEDFFAVRNALFAKRIVAPATAPLTAPVKGA